MKKVIVSIVVLVALVFVAFNYNNWYDSYNLKKAVYTYYETGKSGVDFEYDGQMYRAYKYVCRRPTQVLCAEGVNIVKRERSIDGYLVDGQNAFNAGRNIRPEQREPGLEIFHNAFGEKALAIFKIIEEAQE